MNESTERPADPGELEDRILPWSQVKVISGLSRTTVWRLQKTGDFPASVQVSRNRVGWRQSDILEWRRSRLPRRLPKPETVVEAPPSRVVRPDPPASRAAGREAAAPAAAAAASPRPRRRPAVPPEQGRFDF